MIIDLNIFNEMIENDYHPPFAEFDLSNKLRNYECHKFTTVCFVKTISKILVYHDSVVSLSFPLAIDLASIKF